jgi:hypothetical protein
MSLDAGGSSFDPAKAADVHKAVFTEEVAGKYRIGAPAVARGGKGWLSVSRLWRSVVDGA